MPYARKGTGTGADAGVPIPAKGIGTRISSACDRLGTRKSAATVSGVSVDSLARYIKEDAMPPFDVAARLCLGAGVSMEWLATGIEPAETAGPSTSQPVSLQNLTLALQLVDEVLSAKALPMPAPDKAELTLAVAELLEEGVPEATVLRFVRAGR